MSLTVAANGLSISHKGSGGFETNSTPDVCKTPDKAIPIPYTIVSKSADLARGSKTVFADGGNTIDIKGSCHSRCTGDEAGSIKGVVSSTNLHESTWITYSPSVYIEGKNASRLSDKMFMNNRNAISGQGGHSTTPVNGYTDEVLEALCEVFCAAREEWLDCKHVQKRSNCRRPSLLARDRIRDALPNGNSRLGRAVANKVGDGFGAAERTLYMAADQLRDAGRKFYDETGLRNAIERRIRRAAATRGGVAVAKMGARAWMKLVPGLNLLGTALDVYEGAVLAADIIGLIRSIPDMLEEAIRVQPDFSLHDADGAVTDIYDFKFDDPIDGYQDDWNMGNNQRQAYTDAANGNPPIAVNNETCNCTSKHGPPSRGMT